MTMAFTTQVLESSTACMEMEWNFERYSRRGNDRSQDDERFPITNRVECAMREAYQNILDCGATVVHIRFLRLKLETIEEVMSVRELDERGKASLDCMRLSVDDEGFVTCMAIEDNGTGIGGDYLTAPLPIPGIRPSPFQAYARGLGNSSKGVGNGSKGVGRTGIMGVSTVRAVFVVTNRALESDGSGGETLAFGLAHLDLHTFCGHHYTGSGRFMVNPTKDPYGEVYPTGGQVALDLASKLGVPRDPAATGTTQFYPSLRDEVTPEAVVAEIVKRHFIPALTGRIATFVHSPDGTVQAINSETILGISGLPEFGGCPEHRELVSSTARLLDAAESAVPLGVVKDRLAQHEFDGETLELLRSSFGCGEPVAVRAEHVLRQRAGNGKARCSGELIHVCIENPAIKSGHSIVMRDDIVKLSSGRPGVLGLTIARGNTAAMLREGEDTSHTKWAAGRMAEKSWPLQAATKVTQDFLTGAVTLYDIVTGNSQEVENRALAVHFGIPAPESRRKVIQGKVDDGTPAPSPSPEPGPEPHPHGTAGTNFLRELVSRDENGLWGVKLTYTDTAAEKLREGGAAGHLIAFAYYQAEGKVKWSDHSNADFDMRKCEFVCRGCVARAVAGNVISLEVESPDFALTIRGPFHPDRKIKVCEVADDGDDSE